MKEKIIINKAEIKKDKRYQFLNNNGNWILIDNHFSARYHLAMGKEVREFNPTNTINK